MLIFSPVRSLGQEQHQCLCCKYLQYCQIFGHPNTMLDWRANSNMILHTDIRVCRNTLYLNAGFINRTFGCREIRGGRIKASRSLFGPHFFIIPSNDLIFGYCGNIWLTIMHVKFETLMWLPSSLIPSFLSHFGPFFTK